MKDGANAVVLLSGGLDSATAAAIAKREGFRVHAMTFRYGQRHAVELQSARDVAKRLDIEDQIEIDIDLRRIGGSALTDDIDVPKSDDLAQAGDGIPVTYVPARNTIFLSFALAWAERIGSKDIFIGVNAVDYSGYPDCRPEFIQAFQAMANLATKAGVEDAQSIRIHTPLIAMKKSEIIRAGLELGVDYGATSSCYDPETDGAACGRCDSCRIRLSAFREIGAPDPRPYRRA